ncbi:MAG: methyltransferase domain-containing protein [Planctomycetes bacterium]|nr:methyltransferase domain-containing protein [Planctomycetota bacterium]
MAVGEVKAHRMRAQYEAWPYPQVPLLASLPSTHPFELHAAWLWDRCGSGPTPARPRLWIAGCGTFQPYAFAIANPKADIVATDLSETSLALARRRCLWHRQRHVQFAPCDLDDPSTWPAGEFDLIECYGVLMNLSDPLATLRRLRSRLSPRGVLRLMVYPHWSRARVFQLQRVARLLGLTANDRHHPAALRAFVRRLPLEHPLRYGFTTYADSKNDAGVVDGFLHAGDRGFTGHQLGALLQGAGLQPAYWFHRPWAQPDVMAERLGLGDRAQSTVLAYLDLWQELRCNFVVCARRADAPPAEVQPPAPHPLFTGHGHGLRHRLRLERLRWFGGKLPSRTGDERLVLRPAAARALLRGQPAPGVDALQLGATAATARPAHDDFAAEADWLDHAHSLRTGRRAPNPLYAHLFAAFELAERHPELQLPDLEAQMGRWLPWADPLEARPIVFGLTPYATYQRFRRSVQEHLERQDLGVASDYGSVRLRNDAAALTKVRALLADSPQLPRQRHDDATLRELYVLLCTHDDLFVTLT